MSDQPVPPRTVAPPISIPEAGPTTLAASRQWQCPRCGSPDLAAAYLVDYGDRFRQLHLAPKALKIPKIARMLRPFLNMVKVNALVCRDCGAIQLEVNPDDFAEAERKFGRR
jgi:hypothetical protein